MRPARRALRLLALLAIVAVAAATTGLSASNSVPATRLGRVSMSITANDLKPAECSSINVTNIVTGSGVLTGTNGNDLVLGGSGIDIIDAGVGDDCAVGGSGLDTIAGGLGTDVCIGTNGATFATCETEVRR